MTRSATFAVPHRGVSDQSEVDFRVGPHRLMRRMHKPDPRLGADEQDKRSVVAIEIEDVDAWLHGTEEVARSLVRLSPVEIFEVGSA